MKNSTIYETLSMLNNMPISKKRLTTYLKQMADFCEKSEAYGLDEKSLIEAKAQAKFSRMLVRLIEGGSFDEE